MQLPELLYCVYMHTHRLAPTMPSISTSSRMSGIETNYSKIARMAKQSLHTSYSDHVVASLEDCSALHPGLPYAKSNRLTRYARSA